jgi:hypothetical protein
LVLAKRSECKQKEKRRRRADNASFVLASLARRANNDLSCARFARAARQQRPSFVLARRANNDLLCASFALAPVALPN